MSAREVAERLRKRRTAAKIQTDEGAFYVRGLSGTERAEYFGKYTANATLSPAERLKSDQYLVALAMCEEDSSPMYDRFEDAFQCACDWEIPTINEAVKKILELSGMGDHAKVEAEKKSDASLN